MIICPIWSHEHIGFINYFLTESPFQINIIAFFYDLEKNALECHKNHCLNTKEDVA